MTRFFNSPFLLGFENLEKLLAKRLSELGAGKTETVGAAR